MLIFNHRSKARDLRLERKAVMTVRVKNVFASYYNVAANCVIPGSSEDRRRADRKTASPVAAHEEAARASLVGQLVADLVAAKVLALWAAVPAACAAECKWEFPAVVARSI